MFANTGLTTVTIPDGVTRIAGEAFEENETITSVIIPDTVTSIEQKAFSWCRALETVVIPDSVVSIGDQAFLACDALKNLTMPDNISNMGNNVFQWCTSLPMESIVIPEGYELENTSITEKGDMFGKTYHHTEKNYLFHFNQNLYSEFFTYYTQSQTAPMRMTRFSTTINGNPAFYYVLSEDSSETPIGYLLYWKQDGYILNLETYTLTFEETVKVAESVVKSAD